MNLNWQFDQKMIFFKAEANEAIGGGHLQRAIAIAKECRRFGINASFIFGNSPSSSLNRVKREGFNLFEIAHDKQLIPETYLEILPENSILIFDTDDFHFYSGHLIDQLRNHGIKTACFTITDAYKISTDLLINPNIISRIQNYDTADHTVKLLGPGYLIFREEFRDSILIRNTGEQNNRLILNFGNADANHLTVYFLDVLERIGSLFSRINIVAGILNQDLEKISSRVQSPGNKNIELHINISNISELYRVSNFAITAAGMAMWEMALFKIPQLVIASSKREIEYVNYLSGINYIYSLGSYSTLPAPDDMAKRIEGILQQKALENLRLDAFANEINPRGIMNIIEKIVEILKND